MNSILALVVTILVGFSITANANGKPDSLAPCSASTRDQKELSEGSAPGILELKLENSDGEQVGVLYASENRDHTLMGQTLYLCGDNDNNFYVKADSLQRWIGEEGDFVVVSTIATKSSKNVDLIHHDEALVSASAETVSLDEKEARLRIIFLSWNFATESAFSGTFYLKIPRTKH